MRLAIRIITPLIVIGLVVGVVFEQRRSMGEVERRFSDKQVHLAQQAAERMSEVFREVRKFLLLLGHVDDVVKGARGGTRTLAIAVSQLREHGVLAACLVNGDSARCTGPRSRGLAPIILALPPCASRKQLCVHGPLLISDEGTKKTRQLLVCSIRSPKPIALAGPARPGRGEVLVVLDWAELQHHLERITRLSQDTYSWVLDHHGRLVMHPEHSEQLGHDALKPAKECMSCHASFDLHRRMHAGATGSGRIEVEQQPKLVAFTPFEVGPYTWSLAVATPTDYVTAEGRRSLTRLALFAGTIMLVMIGGALFLDREATRRLRAAASFNHALERKVQERTLELRELYERLASLQAHHTRLERTAVAGEMASIVAHEIRTPLNALSINAQVISDLLRGAEIHGEALEVLKTLEDEIQRVNALLEDNLLSMVRRTPTVPQPLCLNEIVQESLRFMESEAGRNGVSLLPALAAGLPQVNVDPAKLRQVLLNILLNALQAMPDGGEVRVSTLTSDVYVVVSIQDNGPGIPGDPANGETFGRIFKPFVTTKTDGTGLGLAICSRLVAAMRGRIEVRSPPGEGATFQVLLPHAQEQEQPCP